MAILSIREENGSERRVEITQTPFKIGKKPAANDLVLGNISVSREHCVIRRDENGWVIEDLGSRNGTFVNGEKITRPEPLIDNFALQIGPFAVLFLDGEGMRAPAVAQPPHSDGAQAMASPFHGVSAPTQSLILPATGEVVAKGLRTPVPLKKKIHDEVLATLDLKHTDLTEQSAEELRAKTTAAARAAVKRFDAERPAWLAAEALVKEVVDEAIGLGPLEDYLADASVDEIMVNGWNKIYVERHGKLELTDKQFTGEEQVLAVIRRILAPIGRRIDESSPMVDARLADGSRVNAIIAPLSLTGPTITIRKFARTPYTHDDLIRFDSINAQMVEFLRLAVVNRKNSIISGGTGSGKTTLLNILSAFIPGTERIVTIEDAAELQLAQDHVISLESKPPSIEGKGEVPIRKLVINSLRMRPDRIVVGECRGGEALDMLQAMNTGHDGSLTTLHANSPRDVLTRLETMVLMAGLDLPSRAIREQIASAVNLVVHSSRLPDGTRKVVNISEIEGMEQDHIVLRPIFEFRQQGFDENGKVLGVFRATGVIPKFVSELVERSIPVDMTIFEATEN